MANENIFVLRWTFDSTEDHFFQGKEDQTEKDFNDTCEDLIDRAVEKAIEHSIQEGEDSYIGWNDIVNELAILLPNYGFVVFNPPTVVMDGPPVISADEEMGSLLSGVSKRNILRHNKLMDTKHIVEMKGPLGEIFDADESPEIDE